MGVEAMSELLAPDRSRGARKQPHQYNTFVAHELPDEKSATPQLPVIAPYHWRHKGPKPDPAQEGDVTWGYRTTIGNRTTEINWEKTDDASCRAEDDPASEEARELALFHNDPRDYIPGGTMASSPWQSDGDLASQLPNVGRRVGIIGSGLSETAMESARHIAHHLAIDPKLKDAIIL